MSTDYLELTSVEVCAKSDFSTLPSSAAWGTSTDRELKLHRIHAYPAKFPAFITAKALQYASENEISVKTLGDVFCGCGTVAFEARRNGIQFWGCDLNPVATLIANAKSSSYQIGRLERYFSEIRGKYHDSSERIGLERVAVQRLKYWYPLPKLKSLAKLRNAILAVTPSGTRYRTFFLCAFSNILKAASRWLTKSIKPQIDPHKVPAPVYYTFCNQVSFMLKAVRETKLPKTPHTQILTTSILEVPRPALKIDMIVTSPPYVTSYEYADLHQLSSLWLGYTNDYRQLRRGSIGSTQHKLDLAKETQQLNSVGHQVVSSLSKKDKAIARSTAKYFLDMQVVSERCFHLLKSGGLALFIIGNTQYKGVHINNAEHLTESLLASGFSRVRVAKRRLSGKILTPYRNSRGRFTKSSKGRHVYAEEFVLIADKP